MNYQKPHVSLSCLLACALPLALAACELDDSTIANKKDGGATTTTTGGTAGAASTTTGMGGAAATTTTSGGNGGSGGAATTTMGAGGTGGSAGPGGSGGAGGSAGGAGGAGGDMGGAGGAGGDMGGAGGAGGDMGGAGGAGGGPIGPVKNPTAVAVVGSNLTLEQHPSNGGSPFTDQCQANEVLIGFDATMDANPDSANPWLKSLSGICGALSLLGSGPYTVGVTQTIKLTTRGGVSDKVFPETTCPPNQMIVGYRGASGNYIDSVGFDCAPLVVTGDATNGYTVAVDMTTLTPIGPLGGTGGGAFGPYPCDAGQVANGVNGHSGAWFDGFGLTCGVVSLTAMRR